MIQQINVFEKDYETLLMRAGSHEKIPFVVRNCLAILEALNKLSDSIKDLPTDF